MLYLKVTPRIKLLAIFKYNSKLLMQISYQPLLIKQATKCKNKIIKKLSLWLYVNRILYVQYK